MILNPAKPVEVKQVGSTIVAAFRNSSPALIWKFDLERNHSFTLALQGDEGDMELGVTSSKGEFYPVARFMSREDADEAFIAVQKALMKRKYNLTRFFFGSIGGLLLVTLLALFLGSYLVVHSVYSALTYKHTPTTANAGPPPQIRNGEPMSADQVLRPPP